MGRGEIGGRGGGGGGEGGVAMDNHKKIAAQVQQIMERED